MSKTDDMLSEQKHLDHCLNQCGYKNSIIDHAINFNNRHNRKTATSIQKHKCYDTLPYYGELSEKVKKIHDYDISMQFTAVSTLKNSLVYPNDKQQQCHQSNVVYEICCNPNFFVKMHILVRHLNHYNIVLNNTVDLVTIEMIQRSSSTYLRVDIKLMSMMQPSWT